MDYHPFRDSEIPMYNGKTLSSRVSQKEGTRDRKEKKCYRMKTILVNLFNPKNIQLRLNAQKIWALF